MRVLSIRNNDPLLSNHIYVSFPSFNVNPSAIGVQVLGSTNYSYDTHTIADIYSISSTGCDVRITPLTSSSAYTGLEFLVIGTV